MLSRRLARRGFDVLIATDGEAGLVAAREARPDLILMDMSLPVMDGWDATRHVKADPATKAIPVIALTAHAMVEDRDKAMAAGSDDDTRLQRALLAHLRQEFSAPAAAIIGYAEMLIEDATGLDLRQFL